MVSASLLKLVKADAPYKWKVVLKDESSGRERTVRFGRQPYEDYTIHKDEVRKERYLSRHQKREDWTKSGIFTAGFWSRWLLWNKPTIRGSLKDVRERFSI
jgi:hypothetical protein